MTSPRRDVNISSGRGKGPSGGATEAMEHWAEWQKEYRHGIVLIWPPDEVRAPINALRARHDPVSFSYTEAHISLSPPLLRAPDASDWRAIDGAVAAVAPVMVEAGPVEAWLHQSVIYLAIRPVAALTTIRNALLATGLFAPPRHKEFVPHMTIMEGLSGTRATEAILAEMKRTVASGSFRLDRLAYLRPDRDFRFTPERYIPLSGA